MVEIATGKDAMFTVRCVAGRQQGGGTTRSARASGVPGILESRGNAYAERGGGKQQRERAGEESVMEKEKTDRQRQNI